MMRVRYFGYNAFVVDCAPFRLVIDPGGSLYLPRWCRPLIPSEATEGATHIIVTHGDPDHHWHTDRVAQETGAAVICGAEMVAEIDGARRMLAPRSRGRVFDTRLERLSTLSPGETIEVDGIRVTGHPGRHGPIPIRLGRLDLSIHPGPHRRLGLGEMVFEIAAGVHRLVVFGDTVFLPGAWDSIPAPDLALIPIGGEPTMTARDAARVIAALRPKAVVPCHYDCPFLFSRAFNRVDPAPFCDSAAAAGIRCLPLRPGESADLDAI